MTETEHPLNYECPITSKSIKLPCAVASCMYHDGSSIKGCRYAQIQEALGREVLTKDLKKRTVCTLFGLEEQTLGTEVRRVVNVLCASEYFDYVYEKSLLDAKPKELEDLKLDQIRYERWRPSSKKISFQDLIATLDFLQTNLR